MALSFMDNLLLSDSDKRKITEITNAYNATTDKAQQQSLHNMAEAIRGMYGYTGGATGDQFKQTNSLVPSLGTFAGSSYDNYSSRIDDVLSRIEDYGDFEYNPDEDESYQAFLTQVNKNAQTVFDNTIAGASVGTGGRPNSWATTIAGQAQADVLSEGASAMATFEQAAYSRWADSRNYSIQELEALMGLDQTAYDRFVDQYNSEVQVYNSALQAKSTAIEEALQRTQLTGYVSNQDSIILGVAAGTPSFEATQRAWAMEDYIKQAQVDAMYSKSSGGGSGGSDDKKTYYTAEEVKDALGINDKGKTKKTADEIGQILSDLYNEGYLSEGYYNKYMKMYGGTVAQPNDRTDGTISKEKYDMIARWRKANSVEDFKKIIKQKISSGAITQEEYQAYLNDNIQ